MKRLLKVEIESPECDDSYIFSYAIIQSLREFASFIKKQESTVDGIDSRGGLLTKNGINITWVHSFK